MAKIDNGCVGMMGLCNWIPTAKELERQEKESAEARAERLAERLRLSGIDERADLRAAMESDGCTNAFGERARSSTSHLSETDCSG